MPTSTSPEALGQISPQANLISVLLFPQLTKSGAWSSTARGRAALWPRHLQCRYVDAAKSLGEDRHRALVCCPDTPENFDMGCRPASLPGEEPWKTRQLVGSQPLSSAVSQVGWLSSS